jgi:cysteine-rich repeat protein
MTVRPSVLRGHRLILFALLATTVGRGAAHAQIDMNGPWRVEIDTSVGQFLQTWDVTQVGTILSAVVEGATWTGSINPISGAFTLTAPASAPPSCPPNSASAVVDATGKTFAGTYTYWENIGGCRSAAFPLRGSRCGNGVLEPGEQCEDGNFRDGDCCSSTCQLDPVGTSCAAPNSCTADTCDGAGTCVPGGPADGRPCDDGMFCNGADTCAGGTCSAHAGDPCLGAGECRGCNEFERQCHTPAGFGCTDDGNACTYDLCDAAGACQHPNAASGTRCADDGVQCTLDECDGSGACTHPPAPPFYECADDGEGCTFDHCDGLGGCQHELLPAGRRCLDNPTEGCGGVCDGVSPACPGVYPPAGTRDPNCPPCQTCDGLGACVDAPMTTPTCRRPLQPGASRLLIKNLTPDRRDRVLWKWRKGEATSLADFGMPETRDGYAFCVYELGTPTPTTALSLVEYYGDPPCGTDPCWRRSSRGLEFRDRFGLIDGLVGMSLRAGAAGKASIAVEGKDFFLPLPDVPTPLSPPLLVQLQGDQGECWEATFSAPARNDGEQLKARSD